MLIVKLALSSNLLNALSLMNNPIKLNYCDEEKKQQKNKKNGLQQPGSQR